MKKLAILIGALVLTGSTFAQKATLDNPWSLEGAVAFGGTNGVTWTAPSFRARYFVKENIAIRATLGFGDGLGTPKRESYTFAEKPDGTGATGTLDISRMQWNAQIGGEYHLKGTDRMSPYFLLGINFGAGKSTATTENSNGTAYASGIKTEKTGGFAMFGIALGAGMDFYVFQNIYVGFELGLSYSNYGYSDVVSKVTAGSSPTQTTTTLGNTKSYLSTAAGNSALRLGWRF